MALRRFSVLALSLLCWTAVAEAASFTVGPVATPSAVFGSAPYGSPFDETVTLPQFNPAAGTLQSVSITLGAVGTTPNWSVDVYNPFAFAVDATGLISGALRLFAPDSTQLLLTGHASPFTDLGNLAPHATTSVVIAVPDSTGTGLLTSPTDLAWFTGTGTVTLPIHGFGYPNVYPDTLDIVSGTAQMGYGSVTATYHYATDDPTIPEPATLTLLGSLVIPGTVYVLRRIRRHSCQVPPRSS